MLSTGEDVVPDWSGKLEILDTNNDSGFPLLLVNGEGAVPKCPMSLAMKGEVYVHEAGYKERSAAEHCKRHRQWSIGRKTYITREKNVYRESLEA